MPTVEELAALDYSDATLNTGNQGLQGDDYSVAYGLHGKSYQWWKAYPNDDKVINALGPNGEYAERDGLIFVKQTTLLNGLAMSTARCMLWNTTRNIIDPEFGLLEKGTTGFSVLPHEAILARYDLIAVTDMVAVGREVVQRDSTDYIKLNRQTVSSIEVVLKLNAGANATIVPNNEYVLDGQNIHWLSDDTVAENDYCSVEYQYAPVWQWIEDGARGVVQKGSDGKFLPQRGMLVMPQSREWKNGF